MDRWISMLNLKNNRVRAILVAMVIFLVGISWFGVLDKKSTEYVDGAIVQASVAFGVARGLNAMISTLQSTTVNFQFGAGVSLGVGEVLDPINDLVEQYSSLMKLSIGSLIVQKILLDIISDTFFKILITVFGVMLVASVFVKSGMYSNVVMKSFVFLVFLRFALVLVVALNAVVDRAFIQEQAERDVTALADLPAQVEKLREESALSPEVRASLLENIELKQAEREDLVRDKEHLEENVVHLEEVHAMAEKRAEEVASQLGAFQRYNYLSRDEGLEKARIELSEKRSALREGRSALRDAERSIADIDEEVQSMRNTLEGRSNSMLESLGAGVSGWVGNISSIGSNINFSGVRERLEDAVSTIVNVMTLFVLRTLILPLIFLFMLIKATQLIWGVDLRKVMASGSQQNAVKVEA